MIKFFDDFKDASNYCKKCFVKNPKLSFSKYYNKHFKVEYDEYKKIVILSDEEYDENTYLDYDIIYSIKSNIGKYYHIITVYKKPNEISDIQIINDFEGFFFDIISRGGHSYECWIN